jgi:hypothetical protein
MGSPISSILAEIFLKNLENEFYPSIINNRNIQYIGRYVDDVLIIYDSTTTTAEAILNEHNIMHPKKMYKMGVEEEKSISFLDLEVHGNSNTINLGIFRKPT